MANRVVKLTLINDLICPNCWIQLHELLSAMTYCKDTLQLPLSFEVQHMPFKFISSACLSDDGPKVERIDFFERRMGKDKFLTMESAISKWADERGIPITFRGVMSTSTRGHRLSQKAFQLGGEKLQTPLLCAVFKAHLEEGKDIGDIDVLSDIAASVGMMTKDEAVAFLKSNELEKEVNDLSDKLRSQGVKGVPVTVIDGKWAVNGSQASEVFIQIFKKLAAAGVHAAPSPLPAMELCA
ncbi:thioredoxin-like protein [Pluteus cervinus]|uniref:Thioredoxin-like protein n=1 Tax=Pluteus cervinus TaxID=181527 RepID=A0ACD3BBM2_9AGAR|nr:thioredoxin-like protein [Pluteus cervinus]